VDELDDGASSTGVTTAACGHGDGRHGDGHNGRRHSNRANQRHRRRPEQYDDQPDLLGSAHLDLGGVHPAVRRGRRRGRAGLGIRPGWRQAGTIPQATFVPGQVIYAYSSAGSSGLQLLPQAIGSSNLRAWVDGQDAVGHAALANRPEAVVYAALITAAVTIL
jgi:hypothetical protein